jgi:hypothetical protein
MRDLRPAGRDVSHRAPEAELDLGCAAGNCATCGSPP